MELKTSRGCLQRGFGGESLQGTILVLFKWLGAEGKSGVWDHHSEGVSAFTAWEIGLIAVLWLYS